MYIQSSSIVQLLEASLRGRPSWRRQLLVPVALTVVVAFNLFLNGLRALDYLIAPGFRDTPVKGPLFVVATPRSGTTFLHHLLALDDQSFTHQKLYQTVLPSVLTNYVAQGLANVERTFRIPMSQFVEALNQRIFRHWRGIHEVRIDTEEEDESLFFVALASPALYLLVPFLESLPTYQDLSEMDGERQLKLSRDYRLTAKRHLYTESQGRGDEKRTLLIKNVLLPSRLGLTRSAFPDAKFVRLVRDPRKAIPSAMSLFYSSWKIHSPSIPMSGPETRALADMFIHHYRLLHEEARGSNSSNVLTIHFEHLVKNPMDAVRTIYNFLDCPMSAEYTQILSQACAFPQSFKSEHSYSLADFGLTETDIIQRLGDVMEDLGYCRDLAGTTSTSPSGLVTPLKRPNEEAEGPSVEAPA